jgi:hypothetical protein
MNTYEIVTGVFALSCGYFCGLGYGYRTVNREYTAAGDAAGETIQCGSRTIENLRQSLRGRDD